MRLINSNEGRYGEMTKFFTCHFKENMTDIKEANSLFRCFIKRLSWHCYKTEGRLKYVAVPEIQPERLEKYGVAVWHYHVMFFNLPYVPFKDLKKLWGHGGVYINARKEVDNWGAYMTGYMAKELTDERLKGTKCYLRSEGLIEPIVIKEMQGQENEKEWSQLLTDTTLFEKKYSAVYGVERDGKEYNSIDYTQYRMKEQPKVHIVNIGSKHVVFK